MPPRRTITGSATATSEQIEMLLEYIKQYPCLGKGYVRGPEARALKNRLWGEITLKLNSLGGAIKTTDQWQKVWADKKCTTKKSAALRYQAARGTGGGPPVGPPLNEIDLKVLAVMGEGFGLPQTSVRTPVILSEENPQPEHVGLCEEIVEEYGLGEDNEGHIPAALTDHFYYSAIATTDRPSLSPVACSSGAHTQTAPAASSTPAIRSSCSLPSCSGVSTSSAASTGSAVRGASAACSRTQSDMSHIIPVVPVTSGAPAFRTQRSIIPHSTLSRSRTPEAASDAQAVFPPSGRPRRLRWRSQSHQVDLRSQILQNSQEKLAELARIREEICNLTQVVTEFVAELKRKS